MLCVCLSFAVLQVWLRPVGSAQFSQNQTDGSKDQNPSHAGNLTRPPGETGLPAGPGADPELSECRLFPDLILDQQNVTSNGTGPGRGLFSDLFGFRGNS